MYRLEPNDFLKKRYVGLWGVLAFQAGFINSIGFLACQRYVSHVTGFGTQIGMSLGNLDFRLAGEMLMAPLFFVFGAWFNGHLTVARSSQGLTPRYDLVTILMPIILIVLMFMGYNNLFGEFGGPHSFQQDYILLMALTFFCGMQNACFATLTKGQIRTTHLTGISTDFGTDLALTLNGKLNKEERSLAIKKNIMRAVTFLCFSIGAIISVIIDSTLKYGSFIFPMITSLFVAYIFYKEHRSIDKNFVLKKS